jgi:lysyl-tRNA synthetase class 2
MNGWRPGASRDALQMRARMLTDIRAFFDAQGVLEVETPLLASSGVTAPGIFNWQLTSSGSPRFLQTSPEYAMKRLLAAGVGDCYQVTRAFRGEESGRYHNPEFTILEWYRLGFDHHQLMAEVQALVEGLLNTRIRQPAVFITYADLFIEYSGLDPLSCKDEELVEFAQRQGVLPEADLSRDETLDLLLSLVITPQLPDDRLTFVHAWPVSQAALARSLTNPSGCAARFELFCGALELANGYWELTDAKEQMARFQSDNDSRRAMGLEEIGIDSSLLRAMEHGLPDCAGVSIGLDRVLMLMLGAERIEDVIAFSWSRS